MTTTISRTCTYVEDVKRVFVLDLAFLFNNLCVFQLLPDLAHPVVQVRYQLAEVHSLVNGRFAIGGQVAGSFQDLGTSLSLADVVQVQVGVVDDTEQGPLVQILLIFLLLESGSEVNLLLLHGLEVLFNFLQLVDVAQVFLLENTENVVQTIWILEVQLVLVILIVQVD